MQKRAGAARGEVWTKRWRSKRRGYQLNGRRRAREGEPLHVAGCMLYWAEGSKSRNTAQLSNSDPAMQQMFLKFLRECFGIEDDQIRISLNVYTSERRTIKEVEAHWLDLLNLPSSCARKHTLNHYPTSSSGLKKDKLPNGTCTLSVAKSTWLLQHIYGAIQEYSGIDHPTWLDGHY